MATVKQTETEQPATVKRRRVFYIHGFDPRGPGAYHRMFAEEAAHWTSITGASLQIGPRQTVDARSAEWTVDAVLDGQTTRTLYTFLRWDDVVRGLWSRGDVQVFGELSRWTAEMVAGGGFAYARRGARPGFLAMLVAPGVVVTLLSVTMILATAMAGAGVMLFGWPGVLAAIAPFSLFLPVWRRFDAAWNISWLSRCFAFICLASRGRSADLLRRADDFGTIIANALSEPVDEVLVVGHSQGAPVAIMTLASLLARRPDAGALGPNLSLLTLGQPISLWTHLAGDRGFRGALAAVAHAKNIPWLDVTSPSDGASACGLSPVDGLTDAPVDRPFRRSPRFHLIVTPVTLRHIRSRPFEYHFQYLKAADVADAYDYFRLTCGPLPLADYRRTWTAFVQEHE